MAKPDISREDLTAFTTKWNHWNKYA